MGCIPSSHKKRDITNDEYAKSQKEDADVPEKENVLLKKEKDETPVVPVVGSVTTESKKEELINTTGGKEVNQTSIKVATKKKKKKKTSSHSSSSSSSSSEDGNQHDKVEEITEGCSFSLTHGGVEIPVISTHTDEVITIEPEENVSPVDADLGIETIDTEHEITPVVDIDCALEVHTEVVERNNADIIVNPSCDESTPVLDEANIGDDKVITDLDVSDSPGTEVLNIDSPTLEATDIDDTTETEVVAFETNDIDVGDSEEGNVVETEAEPELEETTDLIETEPEPEGTNEIDETEVDEIDETEVDDIGEEDE